MIRSALSLVGLLVACAGVGLFVAVGVYAWTLKAEVNRQATGLAKKANDAGDVADHAIGFVRGVIDQARTELDNARAQGTQATGQPVNPFVRAAALQASKNLAGSVERAHGAVVTASDAVMVATTALEVFNTNEELRQFFGVRPDQLTATQSALGNVSSELRQAKSVLGVPVGAGDPLTTEQLNAVGRALEQARGFSDELEKVVATARGRVNDTKTTVDRWAWRVALATSLIAALGATGQLFMARFCWRRLRDLPA